jgi:hypothetical protein
MTELACCVVPQCPGHVGWLVRGWLAHPPTHPLVNPTKPGEGGLLDFFGSGISGVWT